MHSHNEDLISQRRYGTSVRVDAVAYGDVHVMRSPRVLYLEFDLKSLREHLVLDPPAQSPEQRFPLGDFECYWREPLLLKAEPQIHFSDARAAELAIDPYLEDWEAWAELTQYGPVEFALRHWAIVDDDPPSGQSANAVATVSDLGRPAYRPEVVRRTSLPSQPPKTFNTSPIIEELRKRFRSVLDYIALPAVEGYLLLTAIEQTHGGRQGAAQALNIDFAVLNRLGKLTAVSDLRNGRKVDKGAMSGGAISDAKLSPEEQAWIVNAAINLLVRLGQRHPEREPRLTLEDLTIAM